MAENKSAVRFQEASEADQGQRIDNYLLKTLKNVPKSLIYRMIRKGEVRVNKGRVQATYRLKIGDMVRIPPPYQTDAVEQAVVINTELANYLKQAVLFENDTIVIINKPSGLAVHGGTGIGCGLIEALRQVRSDLTFLELAHRLDRETSGCLLLAKKRSELIRLHALLRNGEIRKTYHALVDGQWPKRLNKVSLPLEKYFDKSGQHKVRVSAQHGKQALTTFQLLQAFREASLIEAHPRTGRTHQIRVHAQISRHAIIGDQRYHDQQRNQFFAKQYGIKRLCLHARKLSFRLEGQQIVAVAPYDWAFESALARLAKDQHE